MFLFGLILKNKRIMITKNIFIITSGIFIGLLFPGFFSGLMAQEVSLPVKTDTIVATMKASHTWVPGILFNATQVNSTGAVATVTSQDISTITTPSITNTLYGTLSGLTVGQGSGEPGLDNANLDIRGIGSFDNGGNNSAAIYVDGFQVDPTYFYNLPQSEIASISVLKDAASLVTFGMNGANGVVWVVTKKGVIGKPKITFNYEYGIGSPENINKPLNSYGYATLYNEAISNDNGDKWSPYYSQSQLQGYQNGTGTNVDWYSQSLRNSSPYTKGNLKFAGGDVHTQYNIIFDYLNQQGLYNVANTASTSNEIFNKYSLAGNLGFNWSIFEAKVDVNARLEDSKAPNYTSYFSTSPIWNNLASYPNNIYPVYDDSLHQHFSGTTTYPNNPVGSLNGLGWESDEIRWLVANFSLKERLDVITKGLYLNEAFSYFSKSQSNYNKTATYARYINGATTTTDITTPIVASGLGAYSQEDWKQTSVTLGYDRQFGKHAITSAVNYYASDLRGEFGNYIDQTYENLSGKANYTYNNRYVGEIGFSYFGDDAYAPGHQWHLYPAVSGAWIVSNEAFLKANQIVSSLKIRMSVGKTGNDNPGSGIYNNGRYLYQQYYNWTGSFYTGNSTPTQNGALNPIYTANPNLGPETSLKYNVGADLTLLNKIAVNMNVFMDKRSGIVTLNNTIPSDYGNNTLYSNIGKMTNKGAEISASYTDQVGEFTYKVNGMASFNQNRIDYMSEIPTAYPYNAQTGRAYGTPMGLESIGFYQTTDFNADGTLKSGIAVPAFGPVQPGDLRYKDLNGDGIIDQRDMTAVGKPVFPELTYSFGGNVAYKGFDLNVLFQGSGLSSFNLLSSNQTIPFVNYATIYAVAANAWAYYPAQGIDTRATATFPRLTTQSNPNNYQTSSFWMKNNDFLRLRNIELGYTFPSAFIKRANISKLRIFVSATNPITWSGLLTNYHIDPESYNGYPALKCINMGISANF
jgi:TonB-linked SusC/RagA family outer membrane protein